MPTFNQMQGNLLQQDASFGLKDNATLGRGLETLDRLLDPAQNRVSVLPRLQQERDIFTAEQQKKQAFKGDFAKSGLQGSRALGAIDEALAASADTQIAQAQYQEAQAQEAQDRTAIQAYLSMVLQPQITGTSLNNQEIDLQRQLQRLRDARSSGSLLGALSIVGGVVLTAFGAGAVGIPLIASGAGQVAGNS
jgi:hypothetical protein